ncbi:MAG: hypothetical protein FD129_3084, partial [bacterium]
IHQTMKLPRFLPFLMAATLVPFCLSGAAAAAPATIAVLPVAVVNGDQDNGPPVSAAIEAVLRDAGHRLTDSDSVAGVLGATRENLATPRTLIQLTRMGRKLGVKYVIYTRLLTVGRPLSATRDSDRSAVIRSGSTARFDGAGSGRAVHRPSPARAVSRDVEVRFLNRSLVASGE